MGTDFIGRILLWSFSDLGFFLVLRFPKKRFKGVNGLKKWASLIWGFAMPILDKQAAVMIQKLF